MRVAFWCIRAEGHGRSRIAGQNSVVFIVGAITQGDPGSALAGRRHDCWPHAVEEVSNKVMEFFQAVRHLRPRIVMGHFGKWAPLVAELGAQGLAQHVCWAAAGPTRADAVDHSCGIWLVGSHARLRGRDIASEEHECMEGEWPCLHAPRIIRFGHDDDTLEECGMCACSPTLAIGRSERGRFGAKSSRLGAETSRGLPPAKARRTG